MQIRTKKGEYTQTYIKFMRHAYDRYLESNHSSIFDVYENPSDTKIYSFEKIKQRAETTPYIIAHNCMKYTAAYFITTLGEEIFVVETANNTYEIESKYL